MKRLVLAIMSVVLMTSVTSLAANGDVAGKIYSTDILAYVNGMTIESYNIGGKTAVIIEDLVQDGRNYGFEYWYEDDKRKLTVNTEMFDNLHGEYEAKRGEVGKITGNIYETDIKVMFNAQEVKGYNIGGKTAVCIEDLGTVTEESPNFEYGYSKYLCNFTWDDSNREVKLNTYRAKRKKMALPPKIHTILNDGNISYSYDEMNHWSNTAYYNFSDEFKAETYKIKPILYNGEKIGEMYFDWNERAHVDLDECMVYNIVRDLPEIMSYEEAIGFIEENFEVIDDYENDSTKYHIAKKDEDIYLLTAKKSGGFVASNVPEDSVFKTDDNGEMYLSYRTAGTPGSGIVEVREYLKNYDYDFDKWKKESHCGVCDYFREQYNITDEISNNEYTVMLDREKRKLIIVRYDCQYAEIKDLPYYDENSTLKLSINDERVNINVSPFGTMGTNKSIDITSEFKYCEFKVFE